MSGAWPAHGRHMAAHERYKSGISTPTARNIDNSDVQDQHVQNTQGVRQLARGHRHDGQHATPSQGQQLLDPSGGGALEALVRLPEVAVWRKEVAWYLVREMLPEAVVVFLGLICPARGMPCGDNKNGRKMKLRTVIKSSGVRPSLAKVGAIHPRIMLCHVFHPPYPRAPNGLGPPCAQRHRFDAMLRWVAPAPPPPWPFGSLQLLVDEAAVPCPRCPPSLARSTSPPAS